MVINRKKKSALDGEAQVLQSATGVSLDGKKKQTQVDSRWLPPSVDAVSRAYSFAALTLSRYIGYYMHEQPAAVYRQQQ